MNENTNFIDQLQPYLQDALKRMDIHEFTETQSLIPDAIEGKDIFIQAPTGSGKTLAYILPILQTLEEQGSGKHFPTALILTPTRELALQVAGISRALLEKHEGVRTAVLTGGVDIKVQIRAFSKGADIVVGTPARVLDHLRRHTFKPKKCTTLVLDEADEMLSMGFEEDVRKVIEALPEHRTMLLSATSNKTTKILADSILTDPSVLYTDQASFLKQKIETIALIVAEKEKPDVLKTTLKKYGTPCIVFCNTIRTCDFVKEILGKNGISSESIHSEMDPKRRRIILADFKSGKLPVLVATDVAARGIDIPSVQLVINYDYPDQEPSLVHRTGRTARAGNTGTAVTFLTPKQREKVSRMETLLKQEITVRKITSGKHPHPHSQGKKKKESKQKIRYPRLHDGRYLLL